ncbi:hypothetical protein [Deefgea rivuli]|uniref:hypothetical protein n=1 Tax=Deefgea rivuli TaxID=400948 RepID=UPI00048050ED|nr:hypothetical protein [Deefgea rivuli]
MPSSASVQSIQLQEGMKIIFTQDNPITLLAMFGLMTFASASLGHRPVVCLQFLPGLDMRLTRAEPIVNDLSVLHHAWHNISNALLAWFEQAPAQAVGLISSDGYELELFQSSEPRDEVVIFSRTWDLPYS